MFQRKENQNNRQDNSNNNSQLRTNLLSEDYGDNVQTEQKPNNNNKQSRERRIQSNNQSQNNIYSSPQRSVRDQNVELEQKQSFSETECSDKRKKSFLEQGEEIFNQGSINNLVLNDHIVFSRGSFRQNEDEMQDGQNNNNVGQNQVQNEQQNDEDQIQKISIVYLKSLRQFLQGQKLNLCYSFVKIFVGSILLFISKDCPYSDYALWVILLICQSTIAIVYNIRSIQLMKSPLFAEEIEYHETIIIISILFYYHFQKIFLTVLHNVDKFLVKYDLYSNKINKNIFIKGEYIYFRIILNTERRFNLIIV